MISIKKQKEIEYMKISGKVTYGVLNSLKEIIKPGMTTKEIDDYVNEYIISHNCTPSFLGYEGFPSSCCISINDIVVHGIPNNTIINNGDVVSVDVGCIYKGYNTDSAYTYIIGDVSEKIKNFVKNTKKALYSGISIIKEGISLNEICKQIEKVANENGYGIFKELTGHGVGKKLHEDPYIPNYSNKESENIILKAGNTLAIEPMFSLGKNDVWLLEDGWAIQTVDKSISAHFEHTILVTKDGYEIITGEWIMAKQKDGYIELEGKVMEVLPGGDFKVKLDNGHIVEAHVSGKMRLNMIRIYPGDTVLMELPICDLKHGRIIYRK